MGSERIAIQLENEQLQQRMKAEEERKQKEEEQKKKDEQLAKSLMAKSEDWVKQKFHSTLSGAQKRTIVSVTDVSSGKNNEIYEKILAEKLKDGKSRDAVEKYLWHGTKVLTNLDLITKNGFDRSYNTTSKYGKG